VVGQVASQTLENLAVVGSVPGGIALDEISLFPEKTFHNRPNGLRADLAQIIADLHPKFVRFPGGCFADEYHWRDGIGPRQQRPKRLNTNWGGVVETNAFGTHEFMDLAEQIGADPYISANVGSGTPQEMMEWMEYMTSDADTELANLRRRHGSLVPAQRRPHHRRVRSHPALRRRHVPAAPVEPADPVEPPAPSPARPPCPEVPAAASPPALFTLPQPPAIMIVSVTIAATCPARAKKQERFEVASSRMVVPSDLVRPTDRSLLRC